mmetsp:Transcript_16258/g.24576  ORF Transcript_16258/g.24576 Transcript_16258/m.24576 type:complete len:747 (-) Transcript_16258:356-2596(-)
MKKETTLPKLIIMSEAYQEIVYQPNISKAKNEKREEIARKSRKEKTPTNKATNKEKKEQPTIAKSKKRENKDRKIKKEFYQEIIYKPTIEAKQGKREESDGKSKKEKVPAAKAPTAEKKEQSASTKSEKKERKFRNIKQETTYDAVKKEKKERRLTSSSGLYEITWTPSNENSDDPPTIRSVRFGKMCKQRKMRDSKMGEGSNARSNDQKNEITVGNAQKNASKSEDNGGLTKHQPMAKRQGFGLADTDDTDQPSLPVYRESPRKAAKNRTIDSTQNDAPRCDDNQNKGDEEAYLNDEAECDKMINNTEGLFCPDGFDVNVFNNLPSELQHEVIGHQKEHMTRCNRLNSTENSRVTNSTGSETGDSELADGNLILNLLSSTEDSGILSKKNRIAPTQRVELNAPAQTNQTTKEISNEAPMPPTMTFRPEMEVTKNKMPEKEEIEFTAPLPVDETDTKKNDEVTAPATIIFNGKCQVARHLIGEKEQREYTATPVLDSIKREIEFSPPLLVNDTEEEKQGEEPATITFDRKNEIREKETKQIEYAVPTLMNETENEYYTGGETNNEVIANPTTFPPNTKKEARDSRENRKVEFMPPAAAYKKSTSLSDEEEEDVVTALPKITPLQSNKSEFISVIPTTLDLEESDTLSVRTHGSVLSIDSVYTKVEHEAFEGELWQEEHQRHRTTQSKTPSPTNKYNKYRDMLTSVNHSDPLKDVLEPKPGYLDEEDDPEQVQNNLAAEYNRKYNQG